jgi:hypothetical protein
MGMTERLMMVVIMAFGLISALIPIATLVVAVRIDRKLGRIAGSLDRAERSRPV